MNIVYELKASLELEEAVAWYLEHAGVRQAEALIRDLNARLALLTHSIVWYARRPEYQRYALARISVHLALPR